MQLFAAQDKVEMPDLAIGTQLYLASKGQDITMPDPHSIGDVGCVWGKNRKADPDTFANPITADVTKHKNLHEAGPQEQRYGQNQAPVHVCENPHNEGDPLYR